MKFAKRVFAAATIYGFITVPPLYFTEGMIARENPPAITHPEFFYGFIGIALAWQVLFWIIARDPVRYRLAMLPGALEKVGFGGASVALYFHGRLAGSGLVFAAVDLLFAALFVSAFRRTPERTDRY